MTIFPGQYPRTISPVHIPYGYIWFVIPHIWLHLAPLLFSESSSRPVSDVWRQRHFIYPDKSDNHTSLKCFDALQTMHACVLCPFHACVLCSFHACVLCSFHACVLCLFHVCMLSPDHACVLCSFHVCNVCCLQTMHVCCVHSSSSMCTAQLSSSNGRADITTYKVNFTELFGGVAYY